MALAVRRQPAAQRAELAQEWAAELHILEHSTDPGRRRTALGFALSLAVRGPVDRAAVVRRGFAVRRPVLVMVLLPTLFAVATVVAFLLGGAVLSFARPGQAPILVVDRAVPDPVGYATMTLAPLTVVVAATLLGWLLGRRRNRLSPAPGAAAICLGTVASVLVVPVVFDAAWTFGGSVGLSLWLVLFGLASLLIIRAGRRAARTAAAVGAVVLAPAAAVTLALGVAMPAGLNRAAALLWYPTSLLDPLLNLPLGHPEGAFWITDYTGFLPHLLLASTLFGVSYLLTASRVPATSTGVEVNSLTE